MENSDKAAGKYPNQKMAPSSIVESRGQTMIITRSKLSTIIK
jgi:hypothetical protein